MKNIQKKVADTILQAPFKLELGGLSYNVESPTLGTLIMVSEEISKMPEMVIKDDSIVTDTLRYAKHCDRIGRICAIFILGARELRKMDKGPKSAVLGLIGKKPSNVAIDRLTTHILNNCSLQEINAAFASIVKNMNVGDFFAITTFLTGVNVTKPTKVVRTTRSGRSSQELSSHSD